MIQSIELKHTNPSMGPYERIISYSLENAALHKTEFERLLNETKVNGRYDLKEFLVAYKNKDKTTIQQVLNLNSNKDLRQGETISVLSITLIGGVVVQIPDLRVTELSGYYPDFIRYLVEHGNRFEFSEGDIGSMMKKESKQGLDNIGDTDISI